MRTGSSLLPALALLLATAAGGAPPAATSLQVRLLAPAVELGGERFGQTRARLVRAWSDDAGTGAPGARFKVLRRVAPRRAAPTGRVAGGLEIGVVGSSSRIVEAGPIAGWERLESIALNVENGDLQPVDDHPPSASTPPVAGGPALNPAAAVDSPLSLALNGVRPNPAHGRAVTLEFALPSADPARLELLDVMGRLVAARNVGTLGAGRHVVNMDAGRPLAPGIYLLRLTQGADVRVTRAVVLE